MAKLKSPLLSLGARGTIADTLTYQKRGTEHIVREKPIPKDPYSLAQAYQRWDYRDYAYLWTLLSNAEKQVYRTKASRYHITGFSQWMREQLKDLEDIAGRWHLDERSGATAFDSSKNGNNGTIFGASPILGPIDYARHFDAINNRIDCGVALSCRLSPPISIEAFIRTTGAVGEIVSRSDPTANQRSYAFYQQGTLRFRWTTDGAAATTQVETSITAVNDGLLHHIAITYDLVNVLFYIDGILDATRPNNTPVFIGIAPLEIGVQAGFHALWFLDLIDEVVIRSRIQPPAEILRHSKRRYP